MTTLTHDDLGLLCEAAISARLLESRDALLTGINPFFRASLPTAPTPHAQILLDLDQMNVAGNLQDGSYPLWIWTKNAQHLSGGRSEATLFAFAARQLASTRAPQGITKSSCNITNNKISNIDTMPRANIAPTFLSYSRMDDNIVSPLVELLRASGQRAFVRYYDLVHGHDINKQLEAAITAAARMILFWSASAACSKEVHEDWTLALRVGSCTIIPVPLDDTPLPPELRAFYASKALATIFREAVSIRKRMKKFFWAWVFVAIAFVAAITAEYLWMRQQCIGFSFPPSNVCAGTFPDSLSHVILKILFALTGSLSLVLLRAFIASRRRISVLTKYCMYISLRADDVVAHVADEDNDPAIQGIEAHATSSA